MYSLISSHSMRSLLIEQVPAFLIALIITELIGELGDFMIEGAIFLVAWFVVDWGYQMLRKAYFSGNKDPAA